MDFWYAENCGWCFFRYSRGNIYFGDFNSDYVIVIWLLLYANFYFSGRRGTILKSEVLGPEHPIYVGEWTVFSHRKRTSEEEAKYVEFMKKKYVSLIATELTLGANLGED